MIIFSEINSGYFHGKFAQYNFMRQFGLPVVSHHCWQVKVLERHRGNFPSNFLFPDPAKYSIKGSETDCRSVQATAIRVQLQQRSNCETNCCLPCNLLLLQLHPNLLICPTPSLIRAGNGEFFEHSTLSDFWERFAWRRPAGEREGSN